MNEHVPPTKPMLSPTALAVAMAKENGFQAIKVTDRAAWLELRGVDVTASVIGALFREHDFMTAFRLYQLKTGIVIEDPEESAPMQRGRLLEPVAVQLLREMRPDWTVDHNSGPGSYYFRDPAARMGATPDILVLDPERGLGVVQTKSVEPSIFRRKWKVDDWHVEPPLWIALQALVEMELTGARWAAVAPLVVSFGVDMPVIDIPATPGLMATVREKIAEFWQMVADGVEPTPEYGKDAAVIAALYGEDDGGTVDLSGWNEGPGLAAEDKTLAAEIKERTKRRGEIKAEFLHRIGDAALATFNGSVLATAKTTRRRAYEVAATSYRDLRIKDVA